MKTNRATILLLLAAALAFSVLGLWFATREDAAREAELAPEATTSREAASPPAAPLASPSERTQVLVADDARAIAAPATTEATAVPVTDTWTVRGVVLDVEGRPVADVDVHEAGHPDAVRARTSADGSFAFSFEVGDLNVAAGGARWTTLLEGHASRARSSDETLVVVAPSIAFAGRVVDDTGAPVEGARVRWELVDATLARFPRPLDRTSTPYPSVHLSRADGTFEYEAVPRLESLTFLADADGFETGRATVDTDTAAAAGVRLVVRRAEDRSRVVRGVVVHADGAPATDARVHLSTRSAPTDTHGAFVLAVPDWLEDSQPLVAVAPGVQAAVTADFGRIAKAGPYPLAPVRLVLGPTALTIRGRVLDEEGRPLAGWAITLRDATSVSRGRVPAITAEDLTAGGSATTSTDESGAFVVEGLFERDYHVAAHDAATLVRIESGPVRAGTQDLVLRRPADALIAEVTGRVVDLDGAPIEGASVTLGLVLASEDSGRSWINGVSTISAPDGGFVLHDVPARFVHIDVGGEPVIPDSFSLADLDPRAPLRLGVARRCHLRIEGLPPSSDPRWLAALDANGAELALWQFQANGWSSMNRVTLAADTTRVYGVSERARTLVLYQPYDTEIARRALQLVAGDVTIVHW